MVLTNVVKSAIAASEYAPFYGEYIALAPPTDLKSALLFSSEALEGLLSPFAEEAGGFAYAEGKWTIADLVLHIIDAELIFLSRAIHIARQPGATLPGYDQDVFVKAAAASSLSLHQLIHLFKSQRTATLAYFSTLPESVFKNLGTADGQLVSVRALGFMIVGHQLHHTKILKERYINKLSSL